MKVLLFVFFVNTLQAEVNAGAEMLAKASRLGDLKTAEGILSSAVNPDLPDKYGRTPIYYAASLNRTEVVELLLAHHADPNAQASIRRDGGEFPATPLQCAAELGNVRMASRLIAAHASLDARNATGRSAVHFAVGHLDVLRLLIEKGANVNARDTEGTSPLDDAVWRGSLDAVAILLAHGAQLNEVQPKTGATPLNEAAYRGKTSVVQYLLRFNPDLHLADKRGYTPLENAVRMGKEDTALVLVDAAGQPAPELVPRIMDGAIKKDQSLLLDALLRHGAPANGLDLAVSAGAANAARVLLEKGADPNRSAGSNSSPLEGASLQGSVAMVKLLLDHSAQVNLINSGSGTTALYAAASFGRANVVDLLLTRGANSNLCGRNRKTPYRAALDSGYKEVASQIQSHGGTAICEP